MATGFSQCAHADDRQDSPRWLLSRSGGRHRAQMNALQRRQLSPEQHQPSADQTAPVSENGETLLTSEHSNGAEFTLVGAISVYIRSFHTSIVMGTGSSVIHIV